MIVNLFDYLVRDQEDGGCCHSKPLYRATLAFIVFYCMWHLANTIITTLVFTRILKAANPDGDISRKCLKVFCIVTLIFFNMHIFAFGFVPRLHQYFEIQKIYHAIRAAVQRNAI